jgi:copper chaperone CopZ
MTVSEECPFGSNSPSSMQFKVTMPCQGCATAVRKAFQQHLPQAAVSIDLPTQRVMVAGVPDRLAVEAALSKAGKAFQRLN